MKSFVRIALPLTASFVPLSALAASVSIGISIGGGTGGGIGGVAGTIISLINSVLVPLIFALAFIVFIYGIADAYIFSRGEPGEVERGHKLMLWGLIGFFVMVSVWGLVNILTGSVTFGNTSATIPGTGFNVR